METLGPFDGTYSRIWGVILGLYGDNGKGNGNHYGIWGLGVGSGESIWGAFTPLEAIMVKVKGLRFRVQVLPKPPQ